jgi:hypothetical protein
MLIKQRFIATYIVSFNTTTMTEVFMMKLRYKNPAESHYGKTQRNVHVTVKDCAEIKSKQTTASQSSNNDVIRTESHVRHTTKRPSQN